MCVGGESRIGHNTASCERRSSLRCSLRTDRQRSTPVGNKKRAPPVAEGAVECGLYSTLPELGLPVVYECTKSRGWRACRKVNANRCYQVGPLRESLESAVMDWSAPIWRLPQMASTGKFSDATKTRPGDCTPQKPGEKSRRKLFKLK